MSPVQAKGASDRKKVKSADGSNGIMAAIGKISLKEVAIIVVFAIFVFSMFGSGDDDSVSLDLSPKAKGSKYQTPDAGKSSGKKGSKYSRPGKGKKNKYSKKGGSSGGYDFEDETADHVSEAIKFDEAGDKESSLHAFDSAARFSPDNFGTHLNYGVALMRSVRFDEARESFKNAKKLNPKDKLLKENMENLERSVKIYAKELEGRGEDPSLAGSGGVAPGGGGSKKKNKYQRPGKGGDPKKGKGKKNKYSRPGKKSAEKINPAGGGGDYDLQDPTADHTGEAIRRDGQGDKEGCLASFESAAKFNPNANSHMNLGVAYMRAQRLDESEAALMQAKEVDPALATLDENIAAMEQNRVALNMPKGSQGKAPAGGGGGDDAGAPKKKNKYQRGGKNKKKYQKPGKGAAAPAASAPAAPAAEYDFEDPTANHVAAGIEFDQNGDSPSCVKAFESAAKFNNDGGSYMNLGVAKMRAGDLDGAQAAMDKAKELDPANGEIDENIAALATTKKAMADQGGGGAADGAAPKKKKKNKYQKV
jgi:Flp pilus assembly protein TadD